MFQGASIRASGPALLLAWVLCGPSLAGDAPPPAAQDPPPAQPAPADRARELIRKLGDPAYGIRTQAYGELKRLGQPALEPLTDALSAEDPEIRTRAAELLIDLRGRGFIGIGLDDDWGEDEPDDRTELTHAEYQEYQMRMKAPREMVIFNDAEEVAPVQTKPGFLPAPVVNVTQVLPPEQAGGRVLPGTKAGLKDGDKLLAVNGHAIKGTADLMREVIYAGPGTETTLLVERDGARSIVPLTLTRNPGDPAPPILLKLPDDGAPPAPADQQP
ncbi:MAG: PDZ domain-containing protein [Planctomycetota bacterium]|nr:PDZ domain-containing protein [Planctomycetota bacterium]